MRLLGRGGAVGGYLAIRSVVLEAEPRFLATSRRAITQQTTSRLRIEVTAGIFSQHEIERSMIEIKDSSVMLVFTLGIIDAYQQPPIFVPHTTLVESFWLILSISLRPKKVIMEHQNTHAVIRVLKRNQQRIQNL